MEANDTDFCDRLPGQHTGRLSLELQASEAAEWQRRIEELEDRLADAQTVIAVQERRIRELQKSNSDWCQDPECLYCNGRLPQRS